VSATFTAFASSLFGDLLSGVPLGTYPEPPDSLVLRILGLDATPAAHEQIRSAFRARLRQVHPDLTETTYAAVPALQDAAEALAMQRPEVAELAWARDVLMRKVRPMPVAGDGRAPADVHEPSR
jgi:hypothetical protein